MVAQLGARRHWLDGLKGCGDPRMLCFEGAFDILLRRRQVEMVVDLRRRALGGESSVQQMIMGQGKTTVIGPLLALCLADGRRLVLQVMPTALLEQSRGILRKVFSLLLPKKIFTLDFDRGEDDPKALAAILDKLRLAQRTHGVVVARPEAVKSLYLKFVEALHLLERGGAAAPAAGAPASARGAGEALLERERLLQVSALSDAGAGVLRLWRSSVLVMDEVDVLLHSLRSEMNFPMGQREQIHMGSDRWDLPIFLLGLLFPGDTAEALAAESVEERQLWAQAEARSGATRKAVLAEVRDALAGAGYAVQRVPHLVLLDASFYAAALAPLVARWLLIWLHFSCLEDLHAVDGLDNELVLAYLLGEAPAKARMEALIERHRAEDGAAAGAAGAAAGEGAAGGGAAPAAESKAPEAAEEDAPPSAQALQVMEVTAMPRVVAEAALHRCGGDVEGAVMLLFSTEDVSPLVAEYSAAEHDRREAQRARDAKAQERAERRAARARAAGGAVRRGSLKEETVAMLNLSADWTTSLLPHAWSKIHRVSYGLLKAHERQAPTAPEHRRLTAIPFLSKDVPSFSSEFAHADVLIGLCVLAYRHHGLRREDLKRVAKALKASFAKESGSKSDRPSFQLFERWKALGARRGAAAKVLGLDLFQPEDAQQLGALAALLGGLPEVVHHYLRGFVFPEVCAFQRLKVSASGMDLGSDALFGTRIGFSGTPSNLLPLDLGDCTFEPGSEGKILTTLASDAVVSAALLDDDWSPRGLLRDIATADPPFHALIDTGALVTGLSNLEVAAELLRRLPPWFQAVVYLNEDDAKVALLRTSGRSVALDMCGVPLERRFAFYDQSHTTGVDLKLAPTARGALTVGKDNTFRDYAQGAYRLRNIGPSGQTVRLLMIPEVAAKVRGDLRAVPGLFQEAAGRPLWPLNVTAWLLLNSMRSEGLQAMQLSLQEMHGVWRKGALARLARDCDAAEEAGAPPEARLLRFEGAPALRQAVDVFREALSHRVPTDVPKPRTLIAALEAVRKAYLAGAPLLAPGEEALARAALVLSRAGAGGMEGLRSAALDAQREQRQEQESEKQQEEMKQREQEEEDMSQFRRDDEEPLPWLARKLEAPPRLAAAEAAFAAARKRGEAVPFACVPTDDDPFYPLGLLQPRAGVLPLPFPRELVLSSNFFRPRWAGLGERRLKNVFVLAEWHAAAGAPPAQRQLMLVTLAEAETMRRMVHLGRCADGPLRAGLALRTVRGDVLDASAGFAPAEAGGAAAAALFGALQCARFFNCDMFYSDGEMDALMASLSAAALEDRRAFFEGCGMLRRRERRLWADTPVARVFADAARWGDLRPTAVLEAARSGLAANIAYVRSAARERRLLSQAADIRLGSEGDEAYARRRAEALARVATIDEDMAALPADVGDVFSKFDADGDGLLDKIEFERFLQAAQLHSVTAADLAALFRLVDRKRSGKIDVEDFVAAFGGVDGIEDDWHAVAAAGEDDLPWACTYAQCPSQSTGMLNDPRAAVCIYCQVQPAPRFAKLGLLPPPGAPKGKWACLVCTLFNDEDAAFCSGCRLKRGATMDAL